MAPGPQREEDRDKPAKERDASHLDDMEVPDVVINVDSSDSDDDEGGDDTGYMGYQVLSQELGQDCDSEGGSDDEELSEPVGYTLHEDTGSRTDPSQLAADIPVIGNTDDVPHDRHACCQSYMKVPDIPRPDRKQILWNQPRLSDISMDPGHADKIRAAMSGFQLPTTHIPGWARSLSDDQILDRVVNRLGTSQTQETPITMETEREITPTGTVSDETFTATAALATDSVSTSSVNTNSDTGGKTDDPD